MVSLALLIAVAAITPGPNNLFVMRAAARSGVAGAAASILAVVLGSLIMLAVAMAGVATIVATAPAARAVMALSGAAYLCWLGAGLVRDSLAGARTVGTTSIRPPLGPAGLFAFQFINPKGWITVLTVSAAIPPGGDALPAWLHLVLLYTLIPAACLSLWSALGLRFAAALERPRSRARFDRTMGLLLVACALSLLVDVV